MVVLLFFKVTLFCRYLHVSVSTKREGGTLFEIIYYGSLGLPWAYHIWVALRILFHRKRISQALKYKNMHIFVKKLFLFCFFANLWFHFDLKWTSPHFLPQ